MLLIEGDPELQLAVRFAIFHLLASAPDRRRGGGRGPRADRAELPGARVLGHRRVRASLPGRDPSRPRRGRCSSTASGACPPLSVRRRASDAMAPGSRGSPRAPVKTSRREHARDRRGEVVPILTGQLEEHIVADVAWAAACYIDWTGDRGVRRSGAGRELLVQTARWWASRIEPDDDGRGAHPRRDRPRRVPRARRRQRVHQRDGALEPPPRRRGGRRASSTSASDAEWLELADAIVDGYDPATGIYEQFAGFYALEPLADRGARAAAAGRGRPAARPRSAPGPAQVVKQADVLMLHYLVPDEVAAGSLEPNLDFYGPRTAHGSTLSPGVHATLLARAGRLAASARDAPPHRPDRPRRHRAHDRRRPAPRRDGRRLADARVRIRRPATRGRRARDRPPPGARMGHARACGCGSATVACTYASSPTRSRRAPTRP